MHRVISICIILCLTSIDIYCQKRTYTTRKIQGQAPRVDGILDDEAWDQVEWTGDFRQREPFENEPATEETRFKILYDENNIYFALQCFDSAPDSIVQRMSRRDGFAGDWIEVNIDSYHDLRTAFSFTVSASGVKGDEAISNGNNWDSSWDPIWNVKTTIDAEGWTAEMQIPLSQLRFGRKEEYIWGLQVNRRLYRKSEFSSWQFISPTASGWVHLFGELNGINNIQPQKQRDITPYVMAGFESYQPDHDNPFAPGKEFLKNFGVDGKWGITNDFTLDFTINPDFGQVEADPSEVNLTTFETKFDERRPFFIEGKNILSFNFENGGGPLSSDNLFYSRRIGRSPTYYPDLEDNEYIDQPGSTTILGAFKLTGKTQKGWSVGVLESLTQKEKAPIDQEGNRREIIVEPMTNYFATRVQKDLNESNTLIGGMVTATNRNLSEDYLKESMHNASYTGGFDFTQHFKDKTYYLILKTAFSRVAGSKTSILETQKSSPHFYQRPDANHLSVDSTRTYLDGFGGALQFGKAGNSKWVYTLWLTWRSPGLNLNEIGYLNRNDEIQEVFWIGFRQREPFSIFRSLNLNVNQWYASTFGLETRYYGANLNGYMEFMNYWAIGFGADREGKSLSTETLRGGPALKNDGPTNAWIFLGTDYRKKIQLSFNTSHFIRDGLSNHNHSYDIGIRYQVSDALKISVYPAFNSNFNKLEWVETLDDLEVVRYIRGTIDQKTTMLTLRFSYNITPDFTVEFYGMPFISAAKYVDFKYITDASANEFENRFVQYTDEQISYNAGDEYYNIDENLDGTIDYGFDQPNFNVYDFNASLVMRWEYQPGSTLFVVWTQNRNKYLSDGSFKLGDDFETLFADTYPHDVFLVKLSYRFDINHIGK
jgi:hypothetical protein